MRTKSIPRRLWAVAYNTHLESVRQCLFLGLLIFAFLLMASALILKDISVHQDLKILKDIGLAATEFFGTLIAIFLGADLIGRDVERRTVHLLLVKPLTRTEFIVGRYLGLCSTIVTSVVLMCVGLMLALSTASGGFSWALVKAVYAITLELCLTGAIGAFLSTTSSRSLALMGSTVICVLGRMTDVLKNASVILEGFPDWLGKTLYYVVPNLQNFDLKTRAVYGDAIPSGILLDLSAYAAAYIAGLLALAALAFRRRDLK
jgi:ABC-type transport system involved in multi-copper enzyme maturation permease subunit